jgi:hypothetical protein
MKHVKNYGIFINEKMGFPEPIKEYSNIIYEKCLFHLNNYLGKKGKFFNKNVTITIDYNEIKNIVPLESFKKFPVEKIIVDFKINLKKNIVDKLSYDSHFNKYTTDKENFSTQSHWIESRHGVVDMTIVLRIEIELLIKQDSNSVDIEKSKEYIKENIVHELTHAYEYNLNRNITNISILSELFDDFKTSKLSENSEMLLFFFYLIYFINKTEINANVSSHSHIKSLTKLKNTPLWQSMKYLLLFNPKYIESMVVKELKKNYDDNSIKYFTRNFGKYFLSLYKSLCDEYKVSPDREILSLENKNMLEVFKYWDLKFKEKHEYIKRKLYKNIETK